MPAPNTSTRARAQPIVNYAAAARKRLLGTWRSDQEKTMACWVFPRRLAASRVKFFRNIFGKNVWRFTPAFCYGEYEELRSRRRYRILWADGWSAVVLFEGGRDPDSCHHLFFDDQYFYLATGRVGNVEYFKKSVA